MELLDIANFKI